MTTFLPIFKVLSCHVCSCSCWSERSSWHIVQRKKQVVEQEVSCNPFDEMYCMFVGLSGGMVTKMLKVIASRLWWDFCNFICFFIPFLLLDLILYIILYVNVCIWLYIFTKSEKYPYFWEKIPLYSKIAFILLDYDLHSIWYTYGKLNAC